LRFLKGWAIHAALFFPTKRHDERMAAAVFSVARVVLGVALAGLTACAGDNSGKGGDGNGGPCEPPDTPSVSFAENVQPIFTRGCAYTSCHVSPSPPEGLNLAAGASFAAIVDQEAKQQPSQRLVDPGKPNDSYLFLKCTPGASFVGSLMPLGCEGIPPSGGCLSKMDKAAIETWITECAQDN
jgi:hypothetical protein